MSEDFSNLSTHPIETGAGRLRIALSVLLLTVLLFITSQVAASLLVGFIPFLRHWPAVRADYWLTNAITAQFAFVLAADGLLLVGIAGALRVFKWRWETIGLRMPQAGHILFGVGAVIPYYVLYLIIVYVLQALIPAFNTAQKQDIGFNSVHGTVEMVLTFISLVLIPPVAEEIAMRGFLYTGLRKWLPKVVAGLAVSVLFGAAHLLEGGNAGPLWIGAIDTFTLSLVLVYLREKTGNLWAGITLHALKNGIAFLLLFIVAGR